MGQDQIDAMIEKVRELLAHYPDAWACELRRGAVDIRDADRVPRSPYSECGPSDRFTLEIKINGGA